MTNLEKKVESLISENIKNLGYELYDVVYEKEAKDYYLRIFIDKPGGISLNDCEKVNDDINDLLDEANYIKDQYFLEISSPGVERVLREDKHLQANIGKEVTCNLFYPIEIDIQQTKSNVGSNLSVSNQKTIEKKKKKSCSTKANSLKQIEGILQNFDNDKIVLNVQLANNKVPTEIIIERKNVANLKLKYNWNKGGI